MGGSNDTAAGDDELAARSRQGDRAAFEQLVRHTARLVYARQYLETGDRHRAEDLTQETFLHAWGAVSKLDDPARFRPWLLAVARSVAADSFRRENRKKRGAERGAADPDAAERVPDPSPTPEESVALAERRRRVRSALKALPEEYSLPLTLRYVGGADYDTIGRQLGLSNGSLRGLLSRGLARLREYLKD